MRRITRALSGSSIDVTALRTSPPFRRVFGGHLLSSIGSEVTFTGLLLLVYDLTRSPFAVGAIGLARVGPTLCFALAGGAIADAMDRRKLLLVVQLALAGNSVALALLALNEAPPLWAIYLLAATGASLAAVDGPVRTAVIPSLVDAATLRSAIQLREVLTQSGRMIGPMLGALLVELVGFSAAFAVDAGTFLLAFVLYWKLPSLVPGQRRRFELSSITEGLRYVRHSRILAGTFIADLIAMVVAMPRALFPAFAIGVYGVGQSGAGLMLGAPAAGAMVGLLLIGGLTARVRREGLAVLVSVAIWGLAIASIGIMPSFVATLALLAIAGAADMISAIFRQTILLSTVPDELRGRMSSVHIMVVTGGPPLGDVTSGTLGEVVGVRPATIIGGLACVGGIVTLGLAIPQFARWVDPRRVEPASPLPGDGPPGAV